jgi:hypothetical protein
MFYEDTSSVISFLLLPKCRIDVLMEILISCWGNDLVHGDKIAYTKMAMGLLVDRYAKPSLAVDHQDLRNSLSTAENGSETIR